ncbi:nuclear transport factor 2 family protein, partial [Vibrio sinaloensis]
MDSKAVVLAYWAAMETNDFTAASEWLSEHEFECYWPQSNELIKGRENFAALNSAYPSEGLWHFTLNTIVVEGNQVVTDVSVTDGSRIDRAITFHTVVDGKIVKQTEFWPDNYPAPEWRSQ